MVIDIVTVPVVAVEAVIVIEAVTESTPGAETVHGMLMETFGSGAIAEAGAAAIDAGTPAVDMIGHATGAFTTEATDVSAEAADVFATETTDMAATEATHVAAAKAATTHVTAAEAAAASHVATATAATTATATATSRLGGSRQQAAGQQRGYRYHHQSFHHDISFLVNGASGTRRSEPARRAAQWASRSFRDGDRAGAQPLNST
jgi:hypothetical protein